MATLALRPEEEKMFEGQPRGFPFGDFNIADVMLPEGDDMGIARCGFVGWALLDQLSRMQLSKLVAGLYAWCTQPSFLTRRNLPQ